MTESLSRYVYWITHLGIFATPGIEYTLGLGSGFEGLGAGQALWKGQVFGRDKQMIVLDKHKVIGGNLEGEIKG